MRRYQRIAILCGLVVMVVAGLFPPWRAVLDTEQLYQESDARYAPIYDPPTPGMGRSVHIDFARLSVQWVVHSAGDQWRDNRSRGK